MVYYDKALFLSRSILETRSSVSRLQPLPGSTSSSFISHDPNVICVICDISHQMYLTLSITENNSIGNYRSVRATPGCRGSAKMNVDRIG